MKKKLLILGLLTLAMTAQGEEVKKAQITKSEEQLREEIKADVIAEMKKEEELKAQKAKEKEELKKEVKEELKAELEAEEKEKAKPKLSSGALEIRVGGSFANEIMGDSATAKTSLLPNSNEDIIDDEASFGYEVAIEGMKRVGDHFFIGLGVAYQDHGSMGILKNVTKETEWDDEALETDIEEHYEDYTAYTSIPVYATLKYEFNPYGNLKPYIKANIGYSFNIQGDLGSVDNGMYYAAGVGVDYKNFIVDLSYQYNEGSVTIPGYTGATVNYDETTTDANVGRVTLGLGYRFN